MNTELSRLRESLLDSLYQTIDLDIRLLHSTEIQPAVIAREHEAVVGIMERLARHPQQAHIQQYSPMNEQEFTRAEPQYLENFLVELSDRIASIRTILDLGADDVPAPTPAAQLTHHMRETMRAGAPNQFTEAHVAFVQTIADPIAYYGRTVAQNALGISLSQPEAPPEQEEAPPPPRRDPTADQLTKVKADVLTHAVRHHESLHPRVVAIALLKAKAWLTGGTLHPATSDDIASFCEDGSAKEGVTLFSSNPRNLTFGLVGATGGRALIHWGLDNAAVRLAAPGAGAPPIYRPSVSAVLFSAPGALSGAAWIVASDDHQNDLDALAMLAKKLDFATNYLSLASAKTAPDVPDTTNEEKEAELLSIAEDL